MAGRVAAIPRLGAGFDVPSAGDARLAQLSARARDAARFARRRLGTRGRWARRAHRRIAKGLARQQAGAAPSASVAAAREASA